MIQSMNKTTLELLCSIVGEDQYSLSDEILEKHAHDASTHPHIRPEIVIYPQNADQVSKILSIASANQIPVTVCGARTSLEGNSIPVHGGIVLDMSTMNRVLQVFPNDFQVVVEPGSIGDVLNASLSEHNLYFPAFPASSQIATIGGMVANNAGGMYAVKYGVVGNWVMELEVVLADGSIITVGSRSIKSVAGYDLKNLFIGSEGTLGIITKVTLKVIPTISAKLLMLASFPTVQHALKATLDIIHANVDPAAVEFLDAQSIKYVNKHTGVRWNEEPTILVEVHGTQESLAPKGMIVKKCCQKNQSSSFIVATTSEEQSKIWDGRKSVHPSIMASLSNGGIVPGDIGVPISAIPEFMKFVESTTQDSNVPAAAFGHIGDGNIHVWLAYDRTDSQSFSNAKSVSEKLVEKALALHGTCTAEHGIGIGKRIYLEKEHEDTIELMKRIKTLFDPQGILNPGKIFL